MHIADFAAQNVSDVQELLSDFTSTVASCLASSACNVLVTDISVFVVYSMYAVPVCIVSQHLTASIRYWSVFAVFSVLSLATSAMQAQAIWLKSSLTRRRIHM